MKVMRYKCAACRALLETDRQHCDQPTIELPKWYRDEVHGARALAERQILRGVGEINAPIYRKRKAAGK